MTILIDSDLVTLMKANSYISDFVICEIDKMYDLQENYVPVSQHFNNLDISVITMFDEKAYRTCQIRLVI